jgi:1-acyl-sn-glycerol-3-phosphate acyltransferase
VRGDQDSAQRLLATVQADLRQGISVLSFPEGTRSANGDLGRFRSGTVRMAVAAGVPLLPVGVVGTARILPKGTWLYTRTGAIGIHVGEPIPTQGLGPADLRRLNRTLRTAIQNAKATAAKALAANS